MAVSGFEGFEKRLELRFTGADPNGPGLRRLGQFEINRILEAAQCTIVSGLGNRFFDSYVLSESSLFIYPSKIIIKTCGTTHLLQSLSLFLHHAKKLGHYISSCTYTRGNFIFPESQPFPHTNFKEEVSFLENDLPPRLSERKSSVLRSKTSHSWHVYTSRDPNMLETGAQNEVYTMEVCMTDLDRSSARRFFRHENYLSGDEAGREMTERSGIGSIRANSVICDFAFDPCGYSMNGLLGSSYSTIHVTPENGYSYASFECVGLGLGQGQEMEEVAAVLARVARVFGPGTLSVALRAPQGAEWSIGEAATVLEPMGMALRGARAVDVPGGGNVVFQAFERRREL
ncbi:hypothetical protein AMTRI_Chr01g114400 [Amborella trichopoda]|uniref:S-adenosylmethionine decarboxylase proenzyme n=1 Tax=Amborella trichopoda TaxID=13333 RepID=W1PX66_AMBTC|nr:S-adenosylmethionine decarboxylase proenzyme 4 [Amborella trichopoda]ERN12431.1 hypothetical protein AMTR_s00025p00139140 [Amborella trichopoda]|eukprot:XP_006850850.1 S-adenosylmethionine decarboxylase proenzyme 4 [Amborella trichopoda]